MIDFHSHVLPQIDDGSRGIDETIRMLEESARQGVSVMAATPHFYADRDSFERFFTRREKAIDQVRAVWRPSFPRLLCGAEVRYYAGMGRTSGLDRLCLEGTRLLLLEMPFSTWSKRMIQEVAFLPRETGLIVVLAHIERYPEMRNAEIWEQLRNGGVQMQSNAEFFLHWPERRRALRLLKNEEIQFLGSDCHNIDSRPPRLGEAAAVIRRKLGEHAETWLEENARRILGETAG